MTPEHGKPYPNGDRETAHLLAERARGGVWLILGTIVFFGIADLGIASAVRLPVYALKAAQLVIAVGSLVLLCRRPVSPERARVIALVNVLVTYVAMASGDYLKGHLATTPLLAVGCATTAAALLPWGLGAQVIVASVLGIGNLVALWASARPVAELVDPAAAVTAVLLVSVYVTYELDRYRRQRARTEEARAQLLDELERANRLKSEFVSTMSHELRTPLNVIMGYTEMLEDPTGPDPALALQRIRGASRELLELVEATLDMNRLESGRDAVQREEVALPALWRELEAELGAVPRPPDVALRWHPAPDVTLSVDRRKLRTVVKNLVGNAIKFTPSGEVEVVAGMEGAGVVLRVRDTGIGIPPEQLPHVFEMFRQVDSSDRRSYGGVGLGLHIVHRLCEQLGGEITVASAPGRGSTFTVTLPPAPAAAAQVAPA